MNRILVTLAAFALAGSPLQAAGTDPNLDYNVLQGRIASLESKVKMLETALNELSAQVAEPAPTLTSATIQPPSAPVEPPVPVQEAPAPEAPAPPVMEVAEVENYYIQEGDTISEVARKLGVPRSDLMEANNLREGQQIYIGDPLVVPQPAPEVKNTAIAESQPAPSSPSRPSASANGGSGTYTVKMGDTLSKIAREHGISVAQLKSANGMTSDLITGGQKLKIPTKGGTTVASNQSATGSDSANQNPPAGAEGIDELLRADEEYGVYTVERGDTLYSLARDFFTTQSEIQRLNKMGKSISLRPGQDLVVPTSKYQEHHNLATNG